MPTRRCKVCKAKNHPDDMINLGMGLVCSEECKTNGILEAIEKGKEERFKEKKKTYKENKKSTRVRALKEVCHEYIRLRDAFEPCICCGLPLGDDYQAGHFQESGNYSAVRYDEDNIHGQRKECNFHKGGDSGEYEVRLRDKIGNERVNRIHRIKRKKTSYTVDDLRALEGYFKAKLAELKQQRESL